MAGDIIHTSPGTMAAPGGHYSHAVTAGGFVFVSGQLPIAPDGAKLNEAPFEEQARQVLDNVAHALAGAGSSIDRLVQVRALIYDSIEYDVLNRVYRQYVGNGPPARTVWTAQSEAGFKIQLDVVAAA